MRTERITGCFFLALGLLMLAPVIRGEITGEARYGQGKVSAGRMVSRQHHPELFRKALNGYKLQSALYLFVGLACLAVVRRMNRLDPMSSQFAGNGSLDALSRHLDHERRIRDLPAPPAPPAQSPAEPQRDSPT